MPDPALRVYRRHRLRRCLRKRTRISKLTTALLTLAPVWHSCFSFGLLFVSLSVSQAYVAYPVLTPRMRVVLTRFMSSGSDIQHLRHFSGFFFRFLYKFNHCSVETHDVLPKFRHLPGPAWPC